MKKVLIAAAALIICTAMSAAVSADVIIEPSDSFYNSHSSEIEGNGGKYTRRFELTAETKVYNDPNGKAVGKLSAGISPYIAYYYTDKSGVKWGGYFDYSGDDELLWITVDGLDYVYDNYSFEEEHKNQITDGRADEYASYRTDKTIYLWAYPGSTESISMETHPDDFVTYVSKIYTDTTGGKWGYISYIWGESGWIYLDDPTDPAPFGEDVSAGAMMTESVYEETDSGNSYAFPAVLAVGAAGVSAAMAFGMKKKKN